MQELKDKVVLIVDDDDRNIFALSCYLEGLGITVHTAGSGIEALDLLQENHQIELVLMDMMMPEMDGFEAIRRIRASEASSGLPVISVTASAMLGDREKCLAAGASEYVSKPVNLRELMDKMVLLLAGK